MGTISLTLPSDGSTAEVSDYNTPINTIKDEINGNLDNDNIKANAGIAGSKLADSAVTTAKIADDAVTDDKLDYPRWWQEIGRTTLSTAGDTITVSSLPTRKYLKVYILGLNVGSLDTFVRFNGDSSASYSQRKSDNGGADSTPVSSTSLDTLTGVITSPVFIEMEIINVANQEKLCIYHSVIANAAGAGTAPSRKESVGKWANTSNAIDSISFINLGTGDFAIGSEVVVLGHD